MENAILVNLLSKYDLTLPSLYGGPNIRTSLNMTKVDDKLCIILYSHHTVQKWIKDIFDLSDKFKRVYNVDGTYRTYIDDKYTLHNLQVRGRYSIVYAKPQDYIILYKIKHLFNLNHTFKIVYIKTNLRDIDRIIIMFYHLKDTLFIIDWFRYVLYNYIALLPEIYKYKQLVYLEHHV